MDLVCSQGLKPAAILRTAEVQAWSYDSLTMHFFTVPYHLSDHSSPPTIGSAARSPQSSCVLPSSNPVLVAQSILMSSGTVQLQCNAPQRIKSPTDDCRGRARSDQRWRLRKATPHFHETSSAHRRLGHRSIPHDDLRGPPRNEAFTFICCAPQPIPPLRCTLISHWSTTCSSILVPKNKGVTTQSIGCLAHGEKLAACQCNYSSNGTRSSGSFPFHELKSIPFRCNRGRDR